MLTHRIFSALVAVPVIILLIWAGQNATAALIAAAAVLGIYEFYRLYVPDETFLKGLGGLTFAAGHRPLLLLGLAGGVLFTVEATLDSTFVLPLIAGAVLVPMMLLVLRPADERQPAEWAWTTIGMLLIGWTLSHGVLLRSAEQGREWVLTVVILTFAIDTTAYVVGRAIGRHRLAPSISPGKTWEGAVAGIIAGAGAAVAITKGFDIDIRIWQAVVLGLLVSVFAQIGDLAESMLKRAAGAKDAGQLIPGHGGILDRLDSLIPAVVVVYYFSQYVER